MLRTRNREKPILEACLAAKQKFVIDKTNLTREEREKYIVQAKSFGFTIVDYCFQSDLKKAIERSNQWT